MPTADGSLIALGRLNGVFGVKGWLKVHSFTSPRTRVFQYQPWWIIEESNVQRSIRHSGGKQQGKHLVVKLADVDDRDAAQLWLGRELYVQRSQLPELPDGEFYWTDLVGLRVETLDGFDLGKVSYLFETGSNDVMVLLDADGKERFVPWIMEQVVYSVDAKQRLIKVDWDPEF